MSTSRPVMWGAFALSVAVGCAAAGVVATREAHAQAPAPPVPPPAGQAMIDTSSPFDHNIHMNPQKMGGKAMGCQACHEMVAQDGATCPKSEVRFPKHEACASCHSAAFYTPPLTICTNCHASTQFQKNNPLKELSRQVTPRKAEFNHRSHMTGKGADCTSCHTFIKGGEAVSHPSHPNCCQCHSGPTPKAKPNMGQCGECHNAAKNAGRPPSKIHDFSHKVHREDPRNSASTQCSTCHTNVSQATTLRTIAAPPMPVCVQCHDGSDPTKPNPQNPQWKGTGAFHFSQCLKCHIAGSIAGTPLPPSHPPTQATP